MQKDAAVSGGYRALNSTINHQRNRPNSPIKAPPSQHDENDPAPHSAEVVSDDEEEMVFERSKHYAGPALTHLSKRHITRYLDKELAHRKLTRSTLTDLRAWWAKSLVVKAHKLDLAQTYTLTQSVTEWWDRLLADVRRPTFIWPRATSAADKTWMISRIEEIGHEKSRLSVRAKRDLEGERVDINKVYRLGPADKRATLRVV